MQQVKRERNALKGLSDEQLSDIEKNQTQSLKGNSARVSYSYKPAL